MAYDFEKILDNIDNQRKGIPPAPLPPVTAPANTELDTLGSSIQRAASANPMEEAKRRKLSGQLGVPSAILPPTAQAEEQAFLKNAKAQEIMTKYPGLAKWAQNPDNAAVAGKDMLTLGEIENTARGLPSVTDSVLGVGKNLAGSAAAAFPTANAAIWSFVQAAGSILSVNVTKPLADATGAPDVGEMLRGSAADFRQRQLGMARDIAPNTSGMGALERGVYSGVQSAATTLMMLPLSVATGSPTPILAGLSGITAGSALGEATDAGLPLDAALVHAAKQGLIEYGTELFPMGNLLKNLTGKTGLVRTAKEFLIREGVGEQVATHLQDLDKWATLNPEKPFSEYIAERPEAALETLVATVVGGSIQVGGAKVVAKGIESLQRKSVLELQQAQRAEEHHLAIQQLGAMAATHPLKERDPQAFHDFMETMVEDGNLSDVYVDGKVLNDVFNQSGITEDELMRKMPEVVQQLGEAMKTNGEVRISLADYATYVVGTDAEKGLLNHLRASPEGMTYTEAQEFYKTQKDGMTKDAEKLMADAAASEEYQADVQKVHDTILEQMNKAGRFTPEVNAAYAVPFREFYAVNAAKMGMTPSQLYEQLPLNFAPMNAGAVLNQAATVATRTTYESRIDEIFKGLPPNAKGVRVLDRADILDLMGYGGEPLNLVEGKVEEGRYNHKLTAAHWKKIPEWLDNPAMVFDSDTVPGRLLFVAPEQMKDGTPIVIIVEPSKDKSGAKVNLLVNAYDRGSPMPLKRWIEGTDKKGGLLRYYDKTKSPAILKRSGLYLPGLMRARSLSGKIHRDDDLVKYRKETPFQLEQNNRAGYNPDTFTISLLKGADLSSTLHEGGHFYLEALADLASRPEAPQQIKDDFRKTLDWFGVDEQSWRGFNLDQKRPYHEQWAQSFERYMLEGKAPTTELQPVFARFRAWMLNVYRSLEKFLQQNPLAGKLNDEVRGIFDRLLAAEDSIRAAESVRSYAPIFENAEEAGITPKQFQDYLDLGEQATQQAIDDMSSRSLRDMKWLSNAKEKVIKELQNEAKAKRKAVEEEVRREVMAEPIEQARTFLKTGEMTDPATGDLIKAEAGFKLDTKAVAELFPASGLVTFDKDKLRGMTSTDGLSPDLAAQMFGFPSGEALILELTTGETAKEKIQGITDQRMLERHGEMSSEEDIQRAAEAAIHNEARARFMATGLKILSKSPLPVNQISKAAKAAAENTIASRKVRDLRPSQYQRAEAQANKEAVKLAGKDPQGAIHAQRAALLNNRLAKAAAEATREVEKALRYVAKFQSKGTRDGLDPEYLEQIDDLLRPFEFKKGTSLKQIDKRQSLADWVSEQEALGFEPAIDPSKLDEAKLKSYKNMTMEELRGFVDSIKQVEHLGRLKKKLLTAKDQREFDAIVLEGLQSIEDNANRIVEEKATPTDAIGIAGKWWRQMTADHRKFSSIMREMDGGKNNGFMFNYFLKTMNEAGDNETQMKAEATEALAKLFSQIKKDPVPGNIYAKKRIVPGTNLSMSHEQRIMFAMNWGNEGNRQRLLDGGITGNRALSLPQAEAVLDTLTKEEWDFVQGVWDYIATYKDRVAALEKRLTGIEPQWIEPAPVQTKYGTYRGGYFPVKYDTELSSRSESFEAATDLRMGMKGAFNASATRNGFTKARAEAVINRPILLSYNAVAQHVSEVTHRLAWQEWLVDANRLLKALDNPIRQHYGAEILRTLRDTVVDIAAGDAPAKNGTETAINRLRVGSTVVGMGWRVTTALLQPSGLAQSWVRVGGKYIARGVKQFMKSPLTSGEFVNSKSKLMTDRGRTMQREINEVLNTIRAGDKVSAFKASYFTMIGKMQRMVDIPTWLGAYERATDELKLQDATTADERARIEEQAAALADQAVLDSQSGGQLKDLAKVQRGSPLQKIFTNFYSYFSATYNLNVEAVRRTNFKSPSQVAMLATDMLLLNTVPIVFSVALKELLKGGCGDDLECLGEKLASEQLNFLFGQMVLLREAGVAIDVAAGGQGYGYQGPAGLRFFADLYKLGQQTNQAEADIAFFKAANQVAGAILHYPAGQINATMEGIIAIEEGKVEGMAILPALIAGPPKK